MTDEAEIGFRQRVLSQRTASLALRGIGPDRSIGLLPERLVCEASGRLYGLEPGAVLALRPHACHPLPLIIGPAADMMLGVFSHGGQLYSLLDLGRLLGNAAEAGGTRAEPAGGTMLLLRGGALRIALRVDRVLGLLTLQAAGSDGALGVLGGNADDPSASGGLLVSLIELGALHDRVASFERPAPPGLA